jgi:hypothetical protein
MTAAPGRRYRIHEQDQSYLIEGGPNRLPVRFHREEFGWLVEHPYRNNRSYCGTSTSLGLFEYRKLLGLLSQYLMLEWQPRTPELRHALLSWAVANTTRAVNKILYPVWQRGLEAGDPEVCQVQRAVFRATLGVGPLVRSPELYRPENLFIRRDIVNIRAAAIAAGHLGARLHPWCGSRPDRAVEQMRDWKALFSPTRKAYPILNRTLAQVPGGVSGVLCQLHHIHLQRPIFDRVELILVALMGTDQHPHNHVLQHATREQIDKALKRVGRYTHSTLSSRKTRDLRQLIQLVSDCPDKHNGNLCGLVDRAIRWHQDSAQRTVAEDIQQLGGDVEVARPPIPVPPIPGVRFLGCVSDICKEGQEMQHCIGGYAQKAVQGYCYLFHVEHDEESASVEVGPDGKVIQSYGHHNRRNRAAQWAERILNEWGKAFPEMARFRQAPTPAYVGWMAVEGEDDIPF